MRQLIPFAALVGLAACGEAVSQVSAASAAAPAPATPSTFAGLWADDPEHCANPQSAADAPLKLTQTSYDQHDTHCAFDTVQRTAPGVWLVAGSCSVKGEREPLVVEIGVVRDTLTFSDNGEPYATFTRCPGETAQQPR